MMPTDLSTPLTLGLVLLAALPWVVKAFQWIGARELARAEDGSKRQDQRLADLEQINVAHALADAKRDRDIFDLQRDQSALSQQIKDLLVTLDTRIQKSGEAQTKALREMQVELKQDITRAMREAREVSAPKRRAK